MFLNWSMGIPCDDNSLTPLRAATDRWVNEAHRRVRRAVGVVAGEDDVAGDRRGAGHRPGAVAGQQLAVGQHHQGVEGEAAVGGTTGSVGCGGPSGKNKLGTEQPTGDGAGARWCERLRAGRSYRFQVQHRRPDAPADFRQVDNVDPTIGV